MANYSTLKESVNAYIKANGVRAITGPVLNGILTQMINTLGDGARYGGIATPAGNPGTVDNVVFYLAFTAGTYTNYGGVTLDGSTLHVFVYDVTWADVDTGVPTSTAFATKADKDEDAVAGNLAKFDSNGNPVDAGIAAEKINQLGQKVTGFTKDQATNPGTANSYWKNDDGVIGISPSGLGLHRADPVECTPGKKATIVTTLGTALTNAVLLCNSDDEVISTIAKDGETTTATITIPANVTKIYVNYLTTFFVSIAGIEGEIVALKNKDSELETKIESVKDEVENVQGKEITKTQEALDHCLVKDSLVAISGVESGKYINNTTGNLVSNSGYNVAYYSVLPGQVYILTFSIFGSPVAPVAFYNDAQFSESTKVKIIPGIASPATALYYVVIVPPNATYLAISYQNTQPSVYSAKYLKDIVDTINASISVVDGRVDNTNERITTDYSIYDFVGQTTSSVYSGKVIDYTGAFVDGAVFSIEEYSVTPGEIVRVTNKNHLGASRMYAFYAGVGGSSPVLIGPNVSTIEEDSFVLTVPQGANYLCISKYLSVETGLDEGTPVSIQEFYEQFGQIENEANIEYVKTGDSISIGIRFKDKKCGITIGIGGRNNLLDFRRVFLYDSTSLISSPTNASDIIASVGDMHGPFKFRNDGQSADVVFTGGNHDYSDVKTATSNYVKFFADGALLGTNASGSCTRVRIEWQNDVKPGNACSSEDSYALRETHIMEFDGKEFEEWVDIEPLVNINMGLWYGFELIPLSGQTNIQFPGSPNRLNYDVSANRNSGDRYCKMVIAESTSVSLSMRIDNSFDIGDRSLSDVGGNGAFFYTSTGKSYFTILSSSSYAINMAQGAHYWLHGWWKILPK